MIKRCTYTLVAWHHYVFPLAAVRAAVRTCVSFPSDWGRLSGGIRLCCETMVQMDYCVRVGGLAPVWPVWRSDSSSIRRDKFSMLFSLRYAAQSVFTSAWDVCRFSNTRVSSVQGLSAG